MVTRCASHSPESALTQPKSIVRRGRQISAQLPDSVHGLQQLRLHRIIAADLSRDLAYTYPNRIRLISILPAFDHECSIFS